MRSAEDYYNEYANMEGGNKSDFIEVLNKARREAINEAAEVATTRTNDESTSIIVDKQSILQLLNKIQ